MNNILQLSEAMPDNNIISNFITKFNQEIKYTLNNNKSTFSIKLFKQDSFIYFDMINDTNENKIVKKHYYFHNTLQNYKVTK